MMNSGTLLSVAIGLGLLLGCQSESEGLVCTQIDLVPRDLEMAGDGRDTTVVDVAVCACSDATTCADAELIDGVSIELQTDAGTLADDVLYLEKGKGAVNWTAPKLICTDCGEAAPAEDDTSRIAVQNAYESLQGTLVGTALDFTGKAQVQFDLLHRFPSDFSLSTDSAEIIADGKTVTEVLLQASDLEDGTLVSLSATVGTVVPERQALQGESARFLYDPGTVSTEGIALLTGKIDAIDYNSFPLTLTLNPAPATTLVLSSESTEIIADGTGTAEIFVEAEGEEDGTVVSVTSTIGEMFPTTQIVVNESAVFLYNPGIVSEETTVVLLGQIGSESQSSNPLRILLLPEPADLSISPAQANLVSTSTATLVATGGIGTLMWASPGADHLSCNGVSGLENCEGSSKATIALTSDPCEEESSEDGESSMTNDPRCEIAIWVTDEEGYQAESSLMIY